MKGDALYIFNASRQWGTYVYGIVAASAVDAIALASKDIQSRIELSDLLRYTLVADDVERGLHFAIELDDPHYEG